MCLSITVVNEGTGLETTSPSLWCRSLTTHLIARERLAELQKALKYGWKKDILAEDD